MKKNKRNFLKKTVFFLSSIFVYRISVPSFKIIKKKIYRKLDEKNNLFWLLKRSD
jgi:hypothetical protein